MSLYQSPKIITDGLVFYTDTNNNKKSYLGRPTTNFITNGDFAGGLNAGTGGSGGDNPLNEVVRFVNPGDSEYCLRSTAVGGNAFTEYQMDLTTQLVANTTYVMSCWYYFSPDWNGTTAIFHARAFSASGANIATGSDAGTTIETKVINGATWRRAYQTITTPSDYSNSFNWYLGYPSSNTTGYRYFTNIQMEQGTYPSPFVKGTRSSTTAINDLTQNNTITANNLTYATDVSTSVSFNGSNSFLSMPNSSSLQVSDIFTINVWVNPTDLSTNRFGIFSTRTINTTGSWQIEVGIASAGQRKIAVTGLGTWIWESANDVISTNTWSNICFVKPGNITQGGSMYLNGVLLTPATTTAYSILNNSDTKVIGQGTSGGQFFPGRISSVSLYNRALTATEVQQNFNALRGRYGI